VAKRGVLQHPSRRALPTDFQLCSECAALVHLVKGPSDRFLSSFLASAFLTRASLSLSRWPHTPSVRPMAQSFGITHALLTFGSATRHRWPRWALLRVLSPLQYGWYVHGT